MAGSVPVRMLLSHSALGSPESTILRRERLSADDWSEEKWEADGDLPDRVL